MGSKKNIREKFRNDVFKRDKNTCQLCKKHSDDISIFDAHHITDRSEMPNGGYVKENGITVCKDNCHMKCEKYHISGGKEWEENLHPNDLYNIIGSTYKIAYEKSLEL